MRRQLGDLQNIRNPIVVEVPMSRIPIIEMVSLAFALAMLIATPFMRVYLCKALIVFGTIMARSVTLTTAFTVNRYPASANVQPYLLEIYCGSIGLPELARDTTRKTDRR